MAVGRWCEKLHYENIAIFSTIIFYAATRITFFWLNLLFNFLILLKKQINPYHRICLIYCLRATVSIIIIIERHIHSYRLLHNNKLNPSVISLSISNLNKLRQSILALTHAENKCPTIDSVFWNLGKSIFFFFNSNIKGISELADSW